MYGTLTSGWALRPFPNCLIVVEEMNCKSSADDFHWTNEMLSSVRWVE